MYYQFSGYLVLEDTDLNQGISSTMKAFKFAQTFLGLRCFQVIIACCGKDIKESGVNCTFVEHKIFSLEVVISVMKSGSCIRG